MTESDLTNVSSLASYVSSGDSGYYIVAEDGEKFFNDVIIFAGYVIVTRVLDLWQLGGTAGLGPVTVNVILILLAVMCLRAQWKLTEVHLLAREMAGVGGVRPDQGAP